jgi:excinuclease ABC subunit C
MNPQLKIKIDNLPGKPGVYIMRNAGGDVIYVGKAKILKNRVRQYFQSQSNHDIKCAKWWKISRTWNI